MRKIILLAVLAASMATPALAINRYNSMSYSCSAAQALIGRERAVIFRHPAERTKNLTLYDRYVSDRGACNFGEYAFEDTLPTKDTKNCPVYTCHSTSELDDDEILPGR
ncbi:hypothetical protein [Rhizobium tumorigenes]|uniref:Uncharacterized protein n=1 Tax=Rhizobium tumorigenes TaxID=2041385 RepID=A0AAF1KVI5_9HYPH|nr:hypothetical protein [Rhizobium tumorigenes]WFR96461.1 hypothetical protein PR017_04840 [Rhizobium tumorigenes]